MEITVSGQMMQAVYSLCFGASFGLLYDVFRAIRRERSSKILAFILDGLFWMICALSIFFFGMTVGNGRQRIFAVVGMVIGTAFYLCLISPFLFRLIRLVISGIAKILWIITFPFRFLLKITKKISTFSKNLFSNFVNRRIMDNNCFRIRKSKSAKHDNIRKGADEFENKAVRYHY